MTLPLPWNVPALDGTAGAETVFQTAFRMLMPAYGLALARLLVADTFARPDSATLDVAETGQSWVQTEPAAGTGFIVSAQAATASVGATAVIDSGFVNVESDAWITPTSGAAGLVLRSDADPAASADRLAVQIDMTAGSLKLNKTDAGTLTTLQSAAQTFVAGTRYLLRVTAVGDSVRAWVNASTVPSINFTLTGGDSTKFGAGSTLTRVGLRNTGSAVFEDYTVRPAYASAVSGALTLADMPAGLVIYAVEAAGSYVRLSSRTDLLSLMEGTSNPGAASLENDIWTRTP